MSTDAIRQARRHLASEHEGKPTAIMLMYRSHELTARRYATAEVMANALIEEMEARGFLSGKGQTSRVTGRGAEE